MRRWATAPSSDWHHYTWWIDVYSRTAVNAFFPVIELTSPYPNWMYGSGTYNSNMGTLTALAPGKRSDYNYYAGSYPAGERILLKDTYTTVRISQADQANPEFPIEVVMLVVRPKHQVKQDTHTDALYNLQVTTESPWVYNRERYEVKSVRTWRPKNEEDSRKDAVFHFKIPCNRTCRTVNGIDAIAASSWYYPGSVGWYLVILHNDQSWLDGQFLRFQIEQRITWIGQT